MNDLSAAKLYCRYAHLDKFYVSFKEPYALRLWNDTDAMDFSSNPFQKIFGGHRMRSVQIKLGMRGLREKIQKKNETSECILRYECSGQGVRMKKHYGRWLQPLRQVLSATSQKSVAQHGIENRTTLDSRAHKCRL